MELRARKRSFARNEKVVDLTAGASAGVGGTGLTVEEAEAFYRDHAEEIVERMRRPSSATNNPAAAIVAQCETDPRLRTEALCAVDDARRASDALTVLQRTLDVYAPMHRPASPARIQNFRSRIT